MSLVILKDPGAVIDYTFDWNDGYLDTTISPAESLLTSAWSIDPAPSPAELAVPLTSPPSESKTATTATAFFSGGVAGKVYIATNRVTTSGGRTDDRSLVIRVEDNQL